MKKLTLLFTCAILAFGCQSNSKKTPVANEPVKEKQQQAKTEASDDGWGDVEVAEPIQVLEMPKNLNSKKVALGDMLFHDKRLSGDNTISCATCHGLNKGGAEPMNTSTGIHGQKGPINSPTVYNSGYNFAQFWDGRAKDLFEQADGPVNNPIEMGSNWKQVIEKLSKDKEFVKQFAQVYPDGLNDKNIRDSIAEFEKSLVTINSPFDKYLNGDQSAISDKAKQGYELFKSKGCTSCHNGPSVGGNSYQKFGLVKDYFTVRGGKITEADLGRYNVTKKEEDKYFFKVPSLRVAVLTAPYFHDASAKTIEEAIVIMGRHQLGVELNTDEVAAIKEFLKSLVGEYKGQNLLTQKN